jgi:mannose-6-phosphate isomerase-like protein (cupin superfamily)
MQTDASLSSTDGALTTTLYLSGTDALKLTVTGQQISGSGTSSYSVILSGDYNGDLGTYGHISGSSVSITKTISATGTLSSDNTANLVITETSTNAPTTISGTLKIESGDQTTTEQLEVPIGSITQITTGALQVKLEDGYTNTISVNSNGLEAETTVSARQISSTSPTSTAQPTVTETDQPSAPPSGNAVSITALSGTAQFKRSGSSEYFQVSESTVLYEGDTIITGANSHLSLQFSDGSTMDVNENTSVTLQSMTDSSQPKIIQLLKGLLHLNEVALQNLKHRFEVRTPTAVCAVRGTEFTVNADNTASTTVTVISGEVNVAATQTGKSVLLQAGESVTVTSEAITQSQMKQSVQSIDTSSIDRWWDNSSSATSNMGSIVTIAVIAVIAVIVVLVVVILLLKRRGKSAADANLPPPPPPP